MSGILNMKTGPSLSDVSVTLSLKNTEVVIEIVLGQCGWQALTRLYVTPSLLFPMTWWCSPVAACATQCGAGSSCSSRDCNMWWSMHWSVCVKTAGRQGWFSHHDLWPQTGSWASGVQCAQPYSFVCLSSRAVKVVEQGTYIRYMYTPPSLLKVFPTQSLSVLVLRLLLT